MAARYSTNKFKIGQELWLPCQVKPGPFDNEPRVYLKIGDQEWFGFVDDSEIRGGKLRAKIIAFTNKAVIIGISGISPTSKTITTTPEAIQRINSVAA